MEEILIAEYGGVISCHNGICYSYGLEKLKNKNNIHRWTKTRESGLFHHSR